MRRSNQLSYEATDLGSWSFVGSKKPVRNQCVIYEIFHILNCRVQYVKYFIAQLVRASHRYHEVWGSNPVEVLNFPGFYIPNCINCVHDCEDHSLLDLASLTSVSRSHKEDDEAKTLVS